MFSEYKSQFGWGDGSGYHMLAEHACGPEGELQAPTEDLGTAAHICLPNAIEAELRGSWGLTGLASQ